MSDPSGHILAIDTSTIGTSASNTLTSDTSSSGELYKFNYTSTNDLTL